MQSTTYSHLQAFLSGWFHQDFDIVGDSIHTVTKEFKRVSPESDNLAVANDIRRFISAFEGHVSEAFFREFELEIDPTALAPNAGAFLIQIANELEAK